MRIFFLSLCINVLFVRVNVFCSQYVNTVSLANHALILLHVSFAASLLLQAQRIHKCITHSVILSTPICHAKQWLSSSRLFDRFHCRIPEFSTRSEYPFMLYLSHGGIGVYTCCDGIPFPVSSPSCNHHITGLRKFLIQPGIFLRKSRLLHLQILLAPRCGC